MSLFLAQFLNGIQLGVMLFMMAAGLTLVFGIMRLINLAHGSLYMMGAYVGATVMNTSGSFLLAIIAAMLASGSVGLIIEFVLFRRLYHRDHLDQVLATIGLIFFFNELTLMIWGRQALFMEVPSILQGTVTLFADLPYPVYRLFIIGVGIAVAVFLTWLIRRTRIGMLIRAGATNAEMVSALGVNIRFLNTLIFGLGAVLAGLAGILSAPLLAVESGMGEPVLILALVVIVIGGIGSIRGAFVGALLVGLVDTLGRAYLADLFNLFLDSNIASTIGSSLASIIIYLLMVIILVIKPQGLFPATQS